MGRRGRRKLKEEDRKKEWGRGGRRKRKVEESGEELGGGSV